MTGQIFRLANRALLAVYGRDAVTFLQGLLTNDIRSLADRCALYALLLNSRGRIVDDLIVYRRGEKFIIESDRNEQSKLLKLFQLYKMHKSVVFERQPTATVYHVSNTSSVADAIDDPRVPSFGLRLLSEKNFDAPDDSDKIYQNKRYDYGIPEGATEMAGEIPVYMNADIMNAISIDKGCYLGQELIARSLNVPVIRKRVVPFTCDALVSGTLLNQQQKADGRVIACNGCRGLALVSTSQRNKQQNFTTEQGPISVIWPKWWPNFGR